MTRTLYLVRHGEQMDAEHGVDEATAATLIAALLDRDFVALEAAVTAGGTVIVRSGSTTARSANMCRLCTASLFRVSGSVTSARWPASLPVPEVVARTGAATCAAPSNC